VCFVVGTLGRGGAERQLIYMLRALRDAGISIRLLCLTKDEPLEDEIKALGIRVTWVGSSRSRFVRLLKIIKELRSEPAHILQSSHFYTNLYVAIAGRLLRIKSIGAIRNDLSSELKSNGKKGWAQLHLPLHLIANSNLACERAIARGIRSDRIDVITNAVKFNKPARQINRNESDRIRILFAARLTEQKRPDRFLRTLTKIGQSRPDLKFTATIAGDGPLRPNLQRLASEVALSGNQVEFLGELKDVRPFYFQSDFFMLTSDWEGTPNVLLEAMACGLPVVATGVGGVPEIVGADRGLVVDVGDEVGLTAAAIRMIDDRDLRSTYSRNGRAYVRRFHSCDTLKRDLLAVYQRVLSK
jgi:glycosyltransferase involved in cell wall biosynthesis